MAEDVNQGRDTLSYTKPSIDIFKAIFASDDEDDDEEEDVGEAGKAIQGSTVTPQVSNGTAARRIDPFPVANEGPVDMATFKPVFSVTQRRRTGGQ